jgi:hypothetical protein
VKLYLPLILGLMMNTRFAQPFLLLASILTTLALYPLPVIGDASNDKGRLIGTWKIISAIIENADGVRVDDDPPPGMYIFTDRYMSNLIVPEWEPRPVITSNSSDEETLGAYSNFIADGGEYWIEENVIQTHNYVALNPIGMRPEQERGEGIRYRFEFDGEQLSITMTNQGWAPNGSITYRLVRME